MSLPDAIPFDICNQPHSSPAYVWSQLSILQLNIRFGHFTSNRRALYDHTHRINIASHEHRITRTSGPPPQHETKNNAADQDRVRLSLSFLSLGYAPPPALSISERHNITVHRIRQHALDSIMVSLEYELRLAGETITCFHACVRACMRAQTRVRACIQACMPGCACVCVCAGSVCACEAVLRVMGPWTFRCLPTRSRRRS